MLRINGQKENQMCLVIDSSILVANTYLYSRSPYLDYKEIRKYSNFLLKEFTSKNCPVMFSDDINDSYFSVGTCKFISMGNQVLVKKFDENEFQNLLHEIFSQPIIESMENAGKKYCMA